MLSRGAGICWQSTENSTVQSSQQKSSTPSSKGCKTKTCRSGKWWGSAVIWTFVELSYNWHIAIQVTSKESIDISQQRKQFLYMILDRSCNSNWLAGFY